MYIRTDLILYEETLHQPGSQAPAPVLSGKPPATPSHLEHLHKDQHSGSRRDLDSGNRPSVSLLILPKPHQLSAKRQPLDRLHQHLARHQL
jgi:hypothetical protein